MPQRTVLETGILQAMRMAARTLIRMGRNVAYSPLMSLDTAVVMPQRTVLETGILQAMRMATRTLTQEVIAVTLTQQITLDTAVVTPLKIVMVDTIHRVLILLLTLMELFALLVR